MRLKNVSGVRGYVSECRVEGEGRVIGTWKLLPPLAWEKGYIQVSGVRI